MNNIEIGKKTIAGMVGVLMVTTALTLIFASGAIAEFRGELTNVEVDASNPNIGENESLIFTFTTEQRLDLGPSWDNGDNIRINQSNFDFSGVDNDNISVFYWDADRARYVGLPYELNAQDGLLGLDNIGMSGDNIMPPVDLKVAIEGPGVPNPTATGTYEFTIKTYAYVPSDGKELDKGSVSLDIVYPDEVTADSVMAENADTTEWFGSINEALTNFEASLSAGDNIIVYDNYSGEPDEGALTWPITVDVAGLTIKAAEGASPTVDATGSGTKTFRIHSAAKAVTIDGLEIIGDEGQRAVQVDSDSAGAIIKNCVIRANGSDSSGRGAGVATHENVVLRNNEFYGNGENTAAVNLRWTATISENTDSSVIKNNVIKNFMVGVIAGDSSDTTIANNTIENIRTLGVAVVSNSENVSGVSVENNEFTDMGIGAGFIEDNTADNTAITGCSVNYNNFENAGAGWSISGSSSPGAAVLTDRMGGTGDMNPYSGVESITSTIDATNNYWNDPAGPLADANEDDTRGDNVDIGADITNNSWLDAAYPDGEEVSSIEFDQDVYSSLDTVSVTARAGYKLGDETLGLTVESEETGESLSLTLEETDDTGVFENSFSLTDNEDLYEEESGYLLVDNVQDTIRIENGLDNNWEMTADAFVDMLAPVVDNIVVSEATDTWLYRGEDNTWAENKIWARGEVEFTANFTENNPENLVFTIGEQSIVRTGLATDGSETISEYVSRIADGPVTITATVADTGGLSNTLEKEIIVDTTLPDVEVVGPEQVGFGPNVENTDIPIEVDADDNVIDNVAGSGVETVVVDVPALENDIPLEYNENSELWENTITASVEDMDNFEISATATDRLAQSDDATGTVDVRWDNTAPAIENSWVVYPEGVTEAKVGDTVTVKATVTDNVQVSSVSLNAENVGLDNEIEMTLIDGDVYSAELENIQVAVENVGMRQLTITTKDTAYNESAGSLDVSMVGYYSSYEIELERGWNLMSLPILPENTEIQAVLSGLGDAKDSVTSVWGYSTIQEQWSWYAPGMPPTPPEIPRLRTMQDGRAYWIKMEEGATLTIEGREMPAGKGGVTPPSYTLHPGWNLVGFTRVGPVTVNEYLGTVEEQVTAMTVFKYSEAGLRTMGGTDTMQPGAGYWVFVSEKATFTAW